MLLAPYGVGLVDFEQTKRPVNLLLTMSDYRTVIRGLRPDIVHAYMKPGMVISKSLRGKTGHGLVTTQHREYASLREAQRCRPFRLGTRIHPTLLLPTYVGQRKRKP